MPSCSSSMWGHFLGERKMKVGDIRYQDSFGEKLAYKVVSIQDNGQAVFELQLGIVAPTIEDIVKEVAQPKEEPREEKVEKVVVKTPVKTTAKKPTAKKPTTKKK